jgi:hypothetical protein
VRKDGPIWKRLVKNGDVEDPELLQDLKEKALARKVGGEKKEPTIALKSASKAAPKSRKSDAAVPRAKRVAKTLIEDHQLELDGMESEAADEHLRKLLTKRLSMKESASEAPSGTESEEEEPVPRRSRPHAPLTSRIHLKSAPIPIPSRARQPPPESESDED